MARPGSHRWSGSTDHGTPEPSTADVARRLTEVLRRAERATALPRRRPEPDTVVIVVDDELAIIAEPEPAASRPPGVDRAWQDLRVR